ncbi:radical SAM protein [candidate division WOR-3 bacterium]|nr:radical SAM protein [candidate division WOR-3 bacterium]
MRVKEIKAKSILRKAKKVDSWFLISYGMNLYRGCAHNCVYCDGRSEGYYVDGEFGHEVTVKINALDILKSELDPTRKKLPLKHYFVGLVGGVGDSYQPLEKKYKLTRRALELFHEKKFPVHILTKSTLVERDIDIIKKINKQNRAIVSFSFSSANDEISSVFEPGVPTPTERLKTLSKFKKEGIACGMYLMPVIPFITDTPEVMENTIKKAKETELDFIVFAGMTLKEGRQKEYFMETLRRNFPYLLPQYENIYLKNKWGETTKEYYESINKTFNLLSKKYKIPRRIPAYLYKDILEENDLAAVILEQLDYLAKLEEKPSPYGYAAYSISKLKEPLSKIKENLRSIKGVGKVTESIIKEILQTGSSRYYENLLK